MACLLDMLSRSLHIYASTITTAVYFSDHKANLVEDCGIRELLLW